VYLVEVKLAGNNSLPNAGRLEIYYNGTWGTMCGRGFDNKDAHVACYMLGFRYFSKSYTLTGADYLLSQHFTTYTMSQKIGRLLFLQHIWFLLTDLNIFAIT